MDVLGASAGEQAQNLTLEEKTHKPKGFANLCRHKLEEYVWDWIYRVLNQRGRNTVLLVKWSEFINRVYLYGFKDSKLSVPTPATWTDLTSFFH